MTWLRQYGPRPLEERFWEKVDKSGECWVWIGGRSREGYGRIRVGGKSGRSLPAHRVALTLSGVVIKPEQFACHHCDNPPCVRPSHLYVGDATTNNRDTVARNAKVRLRPAGTGAHISTALTAWNAAHPRPRLTHCKRGHAFAQTAYVKKNGKRFCTVCNAEARRRRLRT